jgi:hypothetical protein
MRVKLACERKNCYMSVFSSGRNILFMKNTLFWRNGVTQVPFGIVKSVLVAGESCTLFHYENWGSFWKVYYSLSMFSSGRYIHFVQNTLPSWIEETHVSLGRKPSMLQAPVSSIFFPCVNFVRIWKEYLLSVKVFK